MKVPPSTSLCPPWRIRMNEVEILLVEDNPSDVELTLRALQKHHLANRVFVVENGEEAIDFLFGTGKYSDRRDMPLPKVVLLDLKLPKVDGIQVLQKIKSEERTKILPVVVLTSSHEERDIINSYNLGVNSYIVKPVEFESFIKAVADLGFYWLLLNKQPQ
jgi:two-component system response regulator